MLNIVLGEFLGLNWTHIPSDCPDVRISTAGGNHAVILPDTLFSFPDEKWLSPTSVPKGPLEQWDGRKFETDIELVAPDVPILFGACAGMGSDAANIVLPIDIFGSAFFMLTRYEEVAAPVFDAHQRFPAVASLAHKAGFLDRPIVDEYVEILWAVLRRLWPSLERKKRVGRIRVTCDVDRPFDPSLRSLGSLARVLAGDVLKRRSATLALERVSRYRGYRVGDHRADPFHTFDWYVSICERAGLAAAFYFIPDRSDLRMDCAYEVFDRPIIALIERLHAAGHEIGTHGSYGTFRDPKQIVKERERLIAAIGRTGRSIEIAGNRQHYLRWDARETADHLDAAGYDYDTTGSFADRPGFRYGTARPFPMWSWRRKQSMRIVQRPLIVMECSVIDGAYLGLGYMPEAYELMSRLKSRSLRFGGDFTLLWHNSHFMRGEDRAWFSELVGAALG